MTTYKALTEWAASGNNSPSSMAIAQRFMGAERAHYEHPLNYIDFGSCYRLLKHVPAIRIEIMRGTSATWDELIDHWPALSEAYEDGLYLGQFSAFENLLLTVFQF